MFGVIGLDAADVRRLLGHKDIHEFRQTGFELGGCLKGQTQTNKKDSRMLGRDGREGNWQQRRAGNDKEASSSLGRAEEDDVSTAMVDATGHWVHCGGLGC